MIKPIKTVRRPKLGEMLVEAGLLTAEQMQQALRMQNERDIKLGEALLALKFLTQQQLNDFLNSQRNSQRLGEQLVRDGKLTAEQLQAALTEQKRSKTRFGEVLLNLGFIAEQDFFAYLATTIGVPFFDLAEVNIDDKVVQLLNEDTARRLLTVPIRVEKDHILVGMVDPTDILAFDELSQIIRQPLRVMLIMERQLLQVLNAVYKKGDAIQGLVQELGDEVIRKRIDFNQFLNQEMLVDAPVVRILRTVFEDAILNNASDIHIEPGNEVLRIRKRVDGQLHESVLREKHIAPPLVSKLKLMAGLDISERRQPQDGRFNMSLGAIEVDVRLSTLPVQFGESVVMRILNQGAGNIRLGQMGFPEQQLERLRGWIRRPHGLVLVVGPTGSGKTTTLYGALNEINSRDKKIITVEDPVEYRLDRINQVQVNPRINLTFASVLRTVLRQDPDVIMVGEMRDQETIDIAIRAALTGHLVLSTLHTNDAPSTAVRLMDMAAKGYAVAASLIGVLSQRLVRRVCPQCVTAYVPSIQEMAWLEAMGEDALGAQGLVHGDGCKQCGHTGYTGRIAVGEMLELDEGLAKALRHDDTEGFLTLAARHPEYRPAHLAALRYARSGLTTLREAMRLGGDSSWNGSGAIGD